MITLAIIGIVAAMTIPTLIQNHQEKVIVTRLKKVYSAMEQAYLMAENENGTPDEWDLIELYSPQGAENLLNTLAHYLKLSKNCGSAIGGCIPDISYKNSSGTAGGSSNNFTANHEWAKAVLADGTSIGVSVRSADCTAVRGTSKMLSESCGMLFVDINGFKPPNQQGMDAFQFVITKSGIVPTGTQDDTAQSFDRTCGMRASGIGCTAWVIFNENLDYMHCDDLSWGGKTTCKQDKTPHK